MSHSSKNIVDLSESLNRDLRYLKRFLEGHKVSLNLIKTQGMVLRSRPNLNKISDEKLQPLPFAIDDSQIEIVEKVEYLGAQLDQNLVWDEHVRFVCTKAYRALRFLKYAKKFLPQKTLSHIYRGIVEPYFRYFSSVLWSYEKTRLLTLQKLQNRAARIVTNSSYDTSADAQIQKLNWPTIEYRSDDVIKIYF